MAVTPHRPRDTEVPSPGDVLAGKYRIDRVIGSGGMGAVVSATHLAIGQRVAIKILLRRHLSDAGLVARFLREARAAFLLRGEHVARVLDAGETDAGVPFMVMELLEGTDLERVLRERGPLPVGVAARFVRDACGGVSEAHSLGIVHRDIKPSNLFLAERQGRSSIVKVVDFGIAKAHLADDAPDAGMLTQTEAVLGSPFYMSPEQIQSPRDVDARTDIWSLGMTLYKLLTGRLAYEAPSIGAFMMRLAVEAPAPISSHRPDIPEGVAAIVHKCLERKPENRFASAEALALALAPFADEVATGPHPRISSSALPAPGPASQSGPRAAAGFSGAGFTPGNGLPVAPPPSTPSAPVPAATLPVPTLAASVRSPVASLPFAVQGQAGASIAQPGNATMPLPMAPIVGESTTTSATALGRFPTGRPEPASTPDLPEGLRPRLRGGRIAAIGVGLALAIGVASWFGLRASDPAAAAGAAAPTATASAAAEVALWLALDPPEAAAFVDGKRVTANPLRIDAGRSFTLRVEAEGRVPVSKTVSATKDEMLRIALEPAAATSVSAPAGASASAAPSTAPSDRNKPAGTSAPTGGKKIKGPVETQL